MYLVEFLNETEIKYVCFKNHASDRSMAYTRMDTTKFISKICDVVSVFQLQNHISNV